jgi:hypothetical protein
MDHQRHKRAPAIILRGSGAGGDGGASPTRLRFGSVTGLRSGSYQARVLPSWMEAKVLGPSGTPRS